MPSDELFAATTTDAADTTSTTTTTDQAAKAESTVPQGLSASDIEARINAATAPLAERTTALQRENEALKLAIQQSRASDTTPTPTSDDFVASFNKDPQAAIKAVADQASSEGLRTLAPHLNTLIGSANSAFLGAQQTRIESEFGEKAWKEVYQPALTERFAQIRRENPFAIADIDRVRMEVDLITGSNFPKVIALRDEHLKGRASVTEAERTKLIEEARKGITTNLTGGIRANPKGTLPELDPDTKQAIADMDRALGTKTDLNAWTKKHLAVQNAKSVDDWLAAQPTKGSA